MYSKCWFPSKANGWELGNFKDLGDGTVEVLGSEGVKIVPKSDVHRYDASHELDHDDMCSMNHLHEGPLLDNLRRRFFADKIYTTTGDVLISVNPYKKIPGLYENIAMYLDVPEDGDFDRSATKPHVYKIANDALVEMLYGKQSLHENASARNQSVVVSGESGAGKTEASKHVMNFLIAADRERKMDSDRGAEEAHLGDAIRNVLIESNVIFEAFGNAKTVRNDNSSRFGKYIKLQYSEDNQLISAYSETFLLEKSRLNNVGCGERNYHVFYQLLRGEKDPALISKLKLRDPSEFKMLLDGNGSALTSDMDPLYGELKHALGTLGCRQEEIHYLWGVVAAILHMGNLTVSMLGEGTGDITVDEDQAPLSTDIGHVRISSSTVSIAELAELLGLVPEMFVSRLSTQRVKVGNRRSVTIKRLNIIDINNNIAALSKWMYSSTFAWLIKKINFAHCSVAPEQAIAKKFTGILDIFGFEILQTNSFEQLCINFTNERLQQQFNEYVFDREQNIYKAEGLEWDSIQYKDNQHVIDLIGKKPNGLLIILEQQGMLNRGGADEGALLSAFNTAHDQKHPAYVKSRFGTDGKFTVKHFAGDVTYIVTSFLEKNNDSLQEDLMELMVCSSNPFIQNAIVCTSMDSMGIEGEPGYIAEIDQSKIVASAGNLSMNTRSDDPMKKMKSTGRRTSLVGADTSAGKKMANSVTVSFQFRSQLDILLLNLRSTSPHYIKCVKPNSEKIPGKFNAEMVIEQLRYSGALEVVRIRQEGFPISLSFAQFYEMFEKLGYKRGWKHSSLCTTPEAKEYTAALCSEYMTFKKEYQLGATKVFMKSECFERMHLAINTFLAKKVRKFQALIRARIACGRYRTGRKGVVKFQSVVRMYLARKRFKKRIHEILELREKERQRIAEERRLANIAYVQRVEGLFAAATNGDLVAVRSLLDVHPEDYYLRNEKDHDRSIFHLACRSGNFDLIRYLQPSRDDIFYKDAQGNNAVHHVMSSGRKSILPILRYFAVVNASDQDNLRDVVMAMEQLGIQPRRPSVLPPPPPSNKRLSTMGDVPEMRAELPPPAPALPEDEEVVSTTTSATASTATSSSQHAPHASTSGATTTSELKSGWLSKRGESQTWRKRWVVLTTEALMYFRNNKDKVPRDTLSFSQQNDLVIQRATDKATAIDIYINTQSVKKKRDRISLMAESEKEMQAWLNLLKAAAGVESQPLRSSTMTTSASAAATNRVSKALPGPMKPLLVLRPTWTSLLLKSVNNARETPLHLLAQYDPSADGSDSGGVGPRMDEEDTLILATWMVGNIAPLNAFNGKGLTPLQVAVQAGRESLATLLAKQGADPSKTMYGTAGTRTSYDLVRNLEFQKLLKAATHVFAQRESSFLSMPPRLRGFHYFSIVFYRGQTREAIDNIVADQFALRVSTFNANQLPVEASQISPPPLIRPVDATTGMQSWLWFEQFFLQVPLDNLEARSYCVVELVRRNPLAAATAAAMAVSSASSSSASAAEAAAAAAAAGTIVLASAKVSLDRDTITSEALTLNLVEGALDEHKTAVHSTLDVELTITIR